MEIGATRTEPSMTGTDNKKLLLGELNRVFVGVVLEDGLGFLHDYHALQESCLRSVIDLELRELDTMLNKSAKSIPNLYEELSEYHGAQIVMQSDRGTKLFRLTYASENKTANGHGCCLIESNNPNNHFVLFAVPYMLNGKFKLSLAGMQHRRYPAQF